MLFRSLIRTFALELEKILRVHRVNDYARYIGAPELHPLVSVIHYDELEHCRHSLNNYDVYGMFIGDEELEDLSYGQLQYVLHRHALMCVARYYAPQLSTSATSTNSDLLPRFEQLLRKYYDDGIQRQHRLPTVKYCAQQLFLSPNYFGDLIRELTGDSATSHIRRFIMQRAQQLLMSGATISDTAESLGFDYPQHFTRQFKKHFGVTPSEFIKM